MATPIARAFPSALKPDGVTVEFADDGEPFDPTLAPAKRINGPTQDFEIGGYGTGLMQKFSRRMSYRRFEGMNRLVLEFDAGPQRQRRSG